MNLLELTGDYLEWIFLAGLAWFVIDTYLLTRYGGRLNRGITVWGRHLLEDEYRFLTSLDKDIVIEAELGWLVKRGWFSFIAQGNGEALICYSRPKWKTSWPVVFYANLLKPQPTLQYRMSLPGLLLWIGMMWLPVSAFLKSQYSLGLFFCIFFGCMLGVSPVVEITGANKFLTDQCIRYLALSNPKEKES